MMADVIDRTEGMQEPTGSRPNESEFRDGQFGDWLVPS
jgi:hypothetical protein